MNSNNTSATVLFEMGNNAFQQGEWTGAAAAFAGTLLACPGHLRCRFRIADCLLNAGEKDQALQVYRALSRYCTHQGAPLHALVAVKMVLLLAPQTEDLLYALSTLYSQESDRIDAELKKIPLIPLSSKPASLLDGEPETLLEKAAHIALKNPLPDPNLHENEQNLPAIPFFSDLDEDAFLAILQKMRLRRFGDEELIFQQGDSSESVYLIADGSVQIKRNLDDKGGITLAHLRQGAVFGEMALISDEPRAASVLAQGNVEILELRRADLVVASSKLPSVREALRAFTRVRFLRNLIATHPFFSALSRSERHDVMDLFVPISFDEDDTMIREGEAGSGLFLLLSGEAEVFKKSILLDDHNEENADKMHLATLRAADLCGEMSLLSNQDTSASVVALCRLEALFLSKNAFDALVQKYPELMKYLAGLTDERLRQNRALLLSHGLFEDDEHIMI